MGIETNKCWTAQLGHHFPKNRSGGVIEIFRTPVSQKRMEISKCAQQENYCKLNDLQVWFLTFFSISLTGFEIFRKVCFGIKVSQGLGVPKTSWLESKYVYNICLNCESRVSPGQHSQGKLSPKLGVGGVFWDFSNPSISKTVGDFKMRPASKLL